MTKTKQQKQLTGRRNKHSSQTQKTKPRSNQNTRIFVPDGPNKVIVWDTFRAAMRGNLNELKEMMRKMRQAGINVNCNSPDGRNLAHYAVMSGNMNILRIVKEAGVDMLSRDFYGNTIAHTAALHGRNGLFGNVSIGRLSYDMLQEIEKIGVDVTQQNRQGHTVLDVIVPANKSGLRFIHGGKCDARTICDEKTGKKKDVFYYSEPETDSLQVIQYLSEKQGETNTVACVKNTLEEETLLAIHPSERESTLKAHLRRFQEEKINLSDEDKQFVMQQNER